MFKNTEPFTLSWGRHELCKQLNELHIDHVFNYDKGYHNLSMLSVEHTVFQYMNLMAIMSMQLEGTR